MVALSTPSNAPFRGLRRFDIARDIGPTSYVIGEAFASELGANDRAILRQLQREGVAIILATHDVELVAEAASRVLLLGDGRVVAEGTPREVLAGSLAFTTAINKLYGGAWLTPQDVLGHIRPT